MFCSRCGTQIDDNAAFCSSCGAATGVANQAPAQSAPVINTTPASPMANGLITIPKLTGLVSIGFAILTFIFMLLPWLSVLKITSVGILKEGMFDVNAMLGLAKVLCIINIFVFVIYLALQFVDVKKLIPQIPAHIDCKKLSAYAFGGICVLQWLFALIGIISTRGLGVTACFIIALVFIAIFAVTVLKEDLVDNLLGNIIKK